MTKNVGFGGVGKVTFHVHHQWWNQRRHMAGFDYEGPGFYDIHAALEVYALISELRDEFEYRSPYHDDVPSAYSAKGKRR